MINIIIDFSTLKMIEILLFGTEIILNKYEQF